MNIGYPQEEVWIPAEEPEWLPVEEPEPEKEPVEVTR